MADFSRRTFVKLAGTVGAMGALGNMLVGCSKGSNDSETSSTSEEDVTQVIVSMSAGSEPEMGFNPVFNWGSGEHAHEPLIQSTLIRTDVNLDFENDLATEYSVSDDGMEWTFIIRDDVKFTDGEPLTAADVAFTINEIVNEAASESDLSMVDAAEALDDTTCVIRLNRPYNALLYLLAVIGIVPEHAYGSDYGHNPIGSGRYILEQWDQGQQVIFRANPDYYGEAPKMNESLSCSWKKTRLWPLRALVRSIWHSLLPCSRIAFPLAIPSMLARA